MQTKLLILLAIAFASTQAIYKCNSTNPYQYKCYTIQLYENSPKSVMDVAKAQHVNPIKLAEFNQVGQWDSFEVGSSIIVPLDQCTPQVGQWGCYTVRKGDSLYAIAVTSNEATYRSQQALIDLNADILWGNNWTIYEGMDLRMPIKRKAPTWETTTQLVYGGNWQNISTIAADAGTTVNKIMQLNTDILFWNQSLNAGMVLAVPKPEEQVKPPSPCVENTYWECVTAVANDSLWKIGNEKLVNDQLICELNNIANCSYITVGQVIAVPKFYESSWSNCSESQGNWECSSIDYCWKQDNSECQWPINQAVMSVYSGGNYDDVLTDEVIAINQDRLPKSKDHQYFFGSTQIRVPFSQCSPNFNYTCLPQGSDELKNFQGPWYSNSISDWFSPMMLYSNWDQGWIPNCQLKGANDYNMIKVPRQSPPVEPNNGYKPEGCEDALYTPQCKQTPGQNTCYKVGFGETVYSIAQQFNLEWQSLCQYNGMDNNCSCLAAEDVYLSIPSAPQSLIDF